jgi:hypothetical protein
LSDWNEKVIFLQLALGTALLNFRIANKPESYVVAARISVACASGSTLLAVSGPIEPIACIDLIVCLVAYRLINVRYSRKHFSSTIIPGLVESIL